MSWAMTGPGAIDKPTVFISHAATDEPIANVVREEIRRIFSDGVEVFASSVPGVIEPGAEWLTSIRDSLTAATAVIVIVTPTSVNRPWVWFEVGASWSKMEEGEGRIIPVCVPEIDKGALPEPLGRLQAMSLGKASETKEIFRALVDQFGFGSLKGFRHAAIKSKLPKYGDLTVADIDLRSGTIYDGPYEGYSDEELQEVIDDQIVMPAWNTRGRDKLIHSPNLFGGQLLHFRQVDERYWLPPGTAQRLLRDAVLERYETEVIFETENAIRFE
jgi:TIR domain